MSEPGVSNRELLDLALEAAWQAGRITLGYFQAGVATERKDDGSPVTVADREAERRARAVIEGRFPDHALVGEETGTAERDSRFRWFVDPIDGTESFVRGVPLYGTLVGLALDGEPIVGVCHLPALGETLAAAKGEGCRWNGRPARVSRVDRLGEAAVAFTGLPPEGTRKRRGWDRLAGAVRTVRGWSDCYGHVLVATGRVDVMVDPAMRPWDCAALVPILEEAGGTFTDWTGRRTIHGGDAIGTNGRLLEAVLALVGDDDD